MNPTWLNGGAHPGYHYQGVAYVEASAPPRPMQDFKPKAYVNPHIVKCSGVVSNKIHVNPNFKGGNYFQRNAPAVAPARDANPAVHVNPYFRRGSSAKGEATEEKPGASGPKTQPDAAVVTAEKAKAPFKQNSTYFWCKSNASTSVPGPGTGPDGHKGKTPPARASTKSLPEYQTKIKTRHKIIRKTNTYQGSSLENSRYKFRLSNRYKVVNVKKSKMDSIPEPAQLKKKNLPSYSTVHFINSSKCVGNSSDVKKNYQLLKMKYSSLNRNANVYKLPNLIKSKYKYINKSFLNKKKMMRLSHQESSSCAHKRCLSSKTKAILKHSYDIRKLFPKKVAVAKVHSRWSWNGTALEQNRFKSTRHLVWRKQSEFEKDVKRIKKSYPNKTVVNIGGILYKSTTNKLTRTKEKKKVVHESKQPYRNISKFNSSSKAILKSGKRHHIIYVRGEKFLLDSNGKTLVRKPSSLGRTGANKYVAKRVDIGGVTYIQKSNNILIRTNTHQARHLLNHAKHKSIALLSNLRKRNNMPCMIYHKFGRCTRHSKGSCIYVHDPKNIAICKKFLKGECSNSHCLLSHNIIKEKIATCHFFLKGNCNRENCPFLHVKVNKKAAICKNFLQGFCSLGQNCKKRHVHQCPDFDDRGSCSRGNKCPYPHKMKKKTKNPKATEFESKKGEAVISESKDSIPSDLAESPPKKQESKCKMKKKGNKTGNVPEGQSRDLPEEATVECIPKRIKLDDLPLFIPLDEK